MTYASLDTGVFTGYPQELYRFSAGTDTWTFCSGDEAVTYESLTYQPINIRRNEITSTEELAKASIEISTDRDNAVGQLFIDGVPEGIVSLTVTRYHRPESPSTANSSVVVWKGRIISVRLSESEIVMVGESVFTSLLRPGLRAMYQRMCRHILYESGCGVLAANFATFGTVIGVAGAVLTISEAGAKANGWFIGGYLSLSLRDRRMIIDHVGTSITLISPLTNVVLGSQVVMYAGCDHLVGTCNTKFNNLNNFGGFPYIPTKNPFSGDAIA